MVAAGLVALLYAPFSKHLLSLSYILFTTGIASGLLALLVAATEVGKAHHPPARSGGTQSTGSLHAPCGAGRRAPRPCSRRGEHCPGVGALISHSGSLHRCGVDSGQAKGISALVMAMRSCAGRKYDTKNSSPFRLGFHGHAPLVRADDSVYGGEARDHDRETWSKRMDRRYAPGCRHPCRSPCRRLLKRHSFPISVRVRESCPASSWSVMIRAPVETVMSPPSDPRASEALESKFIKT